MLNDVGEIECHYGAMLSIVAGVILIITSSDGFTHDDTRDAIVEVSASHNISHSLLDCIVRRESGYNPYAVGLQREVGPVQLHPRGELNNFYRHGYTNPNDPFQSIEFLAIRINQGAGNRWTAWHQCR